MDVDINQEQIISGAIAGILGTIAFGALFHGIGRTGLMETMIPALYGLEPSLAAGWAIHLFHGAILGVIFVAALSQSPYSEHLEDVAKSAGMGLGYGLLTTVLFAAILMPLWLDAVGMDAPAVPNFDPMGLVGHLIYGVVLGASYTLIKQQLE